LSSERVDSELEELESLLIGGLALRSFHISGEAQF